MGDRNSDFVEYRSFLFTKDIMSFLKCSIFDQYPKASIYIASDSNFAKGIVLNNTMNHDVFSFTPKATQVVGEWRETCGNPFPVIFPRKSISCHFRPFPAIVCLATSMTMTGNTRKSMAANFGKCRLFYPDFHGRPLYAWLSRCAWRVLWGKAIDAFFVWKVLLHKFLALFLPFLPRLLQFFFRPFMVIRSRRTFS